MRDENDQEGIVIKLIIIADDLTGALDSSVHFARKGIRTAVLIDMAQGLEPYAGSDIEVLAVNTASRHDAPEVAAGKIEKIVSEAMELKIPYIYKKTDSALREISERSCRACIRLQRFGSFLLYRHIRN